MFTLSFQDQGFNSVDAESSITRHGPFSPTAAVIEGTPGPPCNQIERGAYCGDFLASKYQKYIFASDDLLSVSFTGRVM